ncbi:MAG: PD-(D/E)XK nuclease-like domain-containing protein [Litorimonas sp.]
MSAPINKPGVYDISMERYHSQCCDGPSVSSSGLRKIENDSPRHFWWNAVGLNPKAKPQPYKPHFHLGTAVHAFLFDDVDEIEKIVVRPDEFNDYRSKAAKAWRADAVESGKTIVTEDLMADICHMADALSSEPGVAELLTAGDPEKSLIWRDAETGIWCKSRPDRLPTDGVLADLKTTDCAAPHAIDRTIAKFGYHMQLALAGDGFEALDRTPLRDAWFVFVETKPPYCVTVARVADELIEFGRMQCRRALRKMADCLKSGDWPSYREGPMTAYGPDWHFKKLQQQFDSGELS